MSKGKVRKARQTDCGHGVVVNGCTVNFSLHVCQGCARALLVTETLMPGLIPVPTIEQRPGDSTPGEAALRMAKSMILSGERMSEVAGATIQAALLGVTPTAPANEASR